MIRHQTVRIMKKFFYKKEEIDDILKDKESIEINKNQIKDFPATIEPSAHTHKKNEITDFPATIEPSAHTHKKNEITDFPTTMTPTSHTHKKSEITDFNHTHSKSEITDFNHTHDKSEITNFDHTHLKNEITDFNHTHSKSEITDFPTTMTPTSHTHKKSEITDFNHTHSKSEITDFPGVATTSSNGLMSSNDKTKLDNITYDSGWTTLKYYSEFTSYNSSYPVQARRIGDIVQLRHAAKPKISGLMFSDWSTYWEIVELPDKFKPKHTTNFTIPVSGKGTAMLVIHPDGYVAVGRFSASDSSGEYELPKTMWINCFATYMVG